MGIGCILMLDSNSIQPKSYHSGEVVALEKDVFAKLEVSCAHPKKVKGYVRAVLELCERS